MWNLGEYHNEFLRLACHQVPGTSLVPVWYKYVLGKSQASPHCVPAFPQLDSEPNNKHFSRKRICRGPMLTWLHSGWVSAGVAGWCSRMPRAVV